jgi:A/G-specific adenine glycosylase
LPGDVAAIRELPGVGRYTANAVATFAFNRPVPIVEANSARVLARLFDIRVPIDSAIGCKRLWENAAQLVPRRNSAHFNSALVDLGALTCLPAKPKCAICPVKRFCRAKNPEALPIKRSKQRTMRLIEKHAFVFRRGKILLERASARWRGMWILPYLERDCLKQSSLGCAVYESIFPFTHHRVTLVVHRCPVPKRKAVDLRWFKSIADIPMPSPHRRAAQSLLSAKQVA